MRFEGVADPAEIPMEPKQWLPVEALVVPGAGATPPSEEAPVLIDVTQKLDGEVVGGLTLGPKPEVAGASARPALLASVATGGNWPLGDMADLYDPAFTFALGLERPVAGAWRLGLQAGYHEFDAETGLPLENLGIVNLSLYGKLLGSAGALRPFAVLGPGAYRVAGSWEPGVLAGLGLEVPVTAGVALTQTRGVLQ